MSPEGRVPKSRPVCELSREPEWEMPPAAAALTMHGAPFLGRGHSEATLEEAIVLGLREARQRPEILRVLVVVLAKHRDVRLEVVRRALQPAELPLLGVVVGLAGTAAADEAFRQFADRLFTEVGPRTGTEPFFTEPRLARYSVGLEERTPQEMRRWGYVCATTLDDFVDAVRKFCR